MYSGTSGSRWNEGVGKICSFIGDGYPPRYVHPGFFPRGLDAARDGTFKVHLFSTKISLLTNTDSVQRGSPPDPQPNSDKMFGFWRNKPYAWMGSHILLNCFSVSHLFGSFVDHRYPLLALVAFFQQLHMASSTYGAPTKLRNARFSPTDPRWRMMDITHGMWGITPPNENSRNHSHE